MSAEESPPFLGSCLCGTVRYEVRSAIKAVSHCHCRMCQKAHGAAFGSYGSVPAADFIVSAGADCLRERASSPGVMRSFCSHCGSPLTWRSSEGEWSSWVSFSLGTLDTPFVPARQRHLHPEATPPWHSAGDAQTADA